MAQAVSCRPITAEIVDQSSVSSCQICGEQRNTGPGCSPYTCFALSAMLHTDHLRVALTGTNVEAWEPSTKATLFRKSRDCRIVSTFIQPHFPISCKSAVPKVCSAHLKGSSTTSQGNPWIHFWNGYLKFNVLLKIFAKLLWLAKFLFRITVKIPNYENPLYPQSERNQ